MSYPPWRKPGDPISMGKTYDPRKITIKLGDEVIHGTITGWRTFRPCTECGIKIVNPRADQKLCLKCADW